MFAILNSSKIVYPTWQHPKIELLQTSQCTQTWFEWPNTLPSWFFCWTYHHQLEMMASPFDWQALNSWWSGKSWIRPIVSWTSCACGVRVRVVFSNTPVASHGLCGTLRAHREPQSTAQLKVLAIHYWCMRSVVSAGVTQAATPWGARITACFWSMEGSVVKTLVKTICQQFHRYTIYDYKFTDSDNFIHSRGVWIPHKWLEHAVVEGYNNMSRCYSTVK